MKTKSAPTHGPPHIICPTPKAEMAFWSFPTAGLWNDFPGAAELLVIVLFVFICTLTYFLRALYRTRQQLRCSHETTAKFVPRHFLGTIGCEQVTGVSLGDHAKREVAVLFTDIRDYTSLSESMTPEENFHFINAYTGRMGPVIRDHRGFINQYLGDAIMSIFPEQPADVLHAAVAMQQLLQRYNKRRKAKGRRPLRVGMGMHYGPLVLGIIGDGVRMNNAAVADAVNIASRIECLTKYFDANILLSEEVVAQFERHSNGVLNMRYLGRVLVKGKQASLGLYECIDGDPPRVQERKRNTMPCFESGVFHFYAKEFHLACTAFREVLRVLPDDRPAHFFLRNAYQYLQHGVPDDWTGVEVMKRK